MRMAEDRFYQKYPCIVITAKGQPVNDLNTSYFLENDKNEYSQRNFYIYIYLFFFLNFRICEVVHGVPSVGSSCLSILQQYVLLGAAVSRWPGRDISNSRTCVCHAE